MSELKPCPFCGGEAKLEKSTRAFVGGKSTKCSLVHCSKCNARTAKFDITDYGRSSHSLAARLDAIEAWNRRVHDETN